MKKGEAGSRELDLLFHRARIEIVAMKSVMELFGRKGFSLAGNIQRTILFLDSGVRIDEDLRFKYGKNGH